MAKTHSLLAHGACRDLLRLLRDEAVAGIVGRPHRLCRNGRAGWCDPHPVGTTMRNRCIGQDTPELAAALARHGALASQASDRAGAEVPRPRASRRGVPARRPDRGIAAVRDGTRRRLPAGRRRRRTHAVRRHEGEPGVRTDGGASSRTGGVDIAPFERLSLALAARVERTSAGRPWRSSSRPAPASTRARSRAGGRPAVEVLTPSLREEDDIRPRPAPGVSARSLHVLDHRIADPVPAAAPYRSGVPVRIPRAPSASRSTR